ncbi:hypothetical protein MRX96_001168 [Rhipicephalus microplus]
MHAVQFLLDRPPTCSACAHRLPPVVVQAAKTIQLVVVDIPKLSGCARVGKCDSLNVTGNGKVSTGKRRPHLRWRPGGRHGADVALLANPPLKRRLLSEATGCCRTVVVSRRWQGRLVGAPRCDLRMRRMAVARKSVASP